MKEATYVAISTQKGGAGKTTLTVLVASYLHYVKGYNVAVVDCDFPQYSIHDMRKRDMKAVMEDGHYKVLAYEQLKRLKKNPYPIRCSRAEDAIRTAENLVEAQPDLDFVFFDLPGTINNADVVQTISKMDYIFTPIIADRVVMESSIKFATVINEQMISTGKSGIKGIYLVWNMVDGREKTELYKAYDKVCAEFALPILETYLPDSKRFRKETAAERKAVFRSTAFPADKTLIRGSNLDKLADEILGIIKKLNVMAKKTRIEDIDSEAVINSFRLDDTSIPPEARSTGGNAPSPPPKEELQTVITSPASRPKEEPERKRRNGKPEKQDYDTVFMCGSNITARLGKQVYIRKEYHDRIQKMLHVIGGNEVTIAAFLDNVLTHHFTLFQDEIAESFKRHMESYNL